MSQLMTKLLARLAEMFPGSNYQSRLDLYISSHRPQSAADVEHLEKLWYRRQGENWI